MLQLSSVTRCVVCVAGRVSVVAGSEFPMSMLLPVASLSWWAAWEEFSSQSEKLLEGTSIREWIRSLMVVPLPLDQSGLVCFILWGETKSKKTSNYNKALVSLCFIFLHAVEANQYWALILTQNAASCLSPSWAEGVAVPVFCSRCGVVRCSRFCERGQVCVTAAGRCPCWALAPACGLPVGPEYRGDRPVMAQPCSWPATHLAYVLGALFCISSVPLLQRGVLMFTVN